MDSKLREIRDRMKLQAELTDNGIEHQVILQQDDHIYLWEQTEKAKELEGNNENLKDRIDHFRYNLRTRRKISEHYKEALEEALDYAKSPRILTEPNGMNKILNKGLRGESE